MPWNYDYSDEIYDGLFISNGPGDPALAWSAVENLRKAMTVSFFFISSVSFSVLQDVPM